MKYTRNFRDFCKNIGPLFIQQSISKVPLHVMLHLFVALEGGVLWMIFGSLQLGVWGPSTWFRNPTVYKPPDIYFQSRTVNNGIHPGRLTWNPKVVVWKMIVLFQGCILRFHNLPRCTYRINWWAGFLPSSFWTFRSERTSKTQITTVRWEAAWSPISISEELEDRGLESRNKWPLMWDGQLWILISRFPTVFKHSCLRRLSLKKNTESR